MYMGELFILSTCMLFFVYTTLLLDAPAKQTISHRGQLTTLLAGEDFRHSQISGKSIPVAGLI